MEGDEDVEEGGASMDLSAVGIVCQKKYDETESCGSASHFLSGAAINAGKADVMEGGGEGRKIRSWSCWTREGGVTLC